jgi:hypothetical protein
MTLLTVKKRQTHDDADRLTMIEEPGGPGNQQLVVGSATPN